MGNSLLYIQNLTDNLILSLNKQEKHITQTNHPHHRACILHSLSLQ